MVDIVMLNASPRPSLARVACIAYLAKLEVGRQQMFECSDVKS